VIGPSQRPLPDNTQHSQQINIHDPGRIRTHNLSKRAAARPLGPALDVSSQTKLKPCGEVNRDLQTRRRSLMYTDSPTGRHLLTAW